MRNPSYIVGPNGNGVGVYGSHAGYGDGVYGLSTHGIGVDCQSNDASSWSLYVKAAGGNHTTTSTHIVVEGSLVAGSKVGYAVDVMRNVGSEPLEIGDVVRLWATASQQ